MFQTALAEQELSYLDAVPAYLGEWRKTQSGLKEHSETLVVSDKLSPGETPRYYARPRSSSAWPATDNGGDASRPRHSVNAARQDSS
jgi:hypothetical protein